MIQFVQMATGPHVRANTKYRKAAAAKAMLDHRSHRGASRAAATAVRPRNNTVGPEVDSRSRENVETGRALGRVCAPRVARDVGDLGAQPSLIGSEANRRTQLETGDPREQREMDGHEYGDLQGSPPFRTARALPRSNGHQEGRQQEKWEGNFIGQPADQCGRGTHRLPGNAERPPTVVALMSASMLARHAVMLSVMANARNQ